MAVNVKTVNGLAYGSVKTFGPTAKASIKSLNGVDATATADYDAYWGAESNALLGNITTDASYYDGASRSTDYAYAGSYSLKFTNAWQTAYWYNDTNDHAWASPAVGTISLRWLYTGAWTNGPLIFQLTGKSQNGALDTNDGIAIYRRTTGGLDDPAIQVVYSYDDANAFTETSRLLLPSPEEGVWYHIVVKWDTAATTKLSLTLTKEGGSPVSTTTDSAIGATLCVAWHHLLPGNDTSNAYTGYIDELYVYPTWREDM